MTTYPRGDRGGVRRVPAPGRRRGLRRAWAKLFTEDALYEEHNLGVFKGQKAIEEWIVSCMKDYSTMTLWMEWYAIDGNRLALYIWNNLPDPTGTGKRFGFPNTRSSSTRGDGKFSFEGDYYNPADAEKVFVEWLEAGGRRSTPQDHSLKGIEGWNPEPPRAGLPPRGGRGGVRQVPRAPSLAVETGDWDQWTDQFTEDAHYREHHYGYFKSQQEIRDWIKSVMQPFPTMEFPVSYYTIDGNRVSALHPEHPPGARGRRRLLRLRRQHDPPLRRQRKWSFEEDVYSPKEAEEVVAKWIAAGGVIPGS